MPADGANKHRCNLMEISGSIQSSTACSIQTEHRRHVHDTLQIQYIFPEKPLPFWTEDLDPESVLSPFSLPLDSQPHWLEDAHSHLPFFCHSFSLTTLKARRNLSPCGSAWDLLFFSSFTHSSPWDTTPYLLPLKLHTNTVHFFLCTFPSELALMSLGCCENSSWTVGAAAIICLDSQTW